jgi:hypothetical protein
MQSPFPRRQFNIVPPKPRSSALETVSSRTNPGSPQGSEHEHTPPRRAVDGQESKGLPSEWDEWDEEWDEEDEGWDDEWEDSTLELSDSNPEEFDGIFDMERHITLEEPEMVCDETLDMVATSDTEPEQNSWSIFSLPALRLVWGKCLVSHHQKGLQGRNTPLHRASRTIFKQAYRRGTAHAVGVWVN